MIDRSRSNGHKLKNKMFCLNTRKHFFILKVTKHWERVPIELVESLSLTI